MPANPLAAVHAELGAFLVERGGTPVPARYTDPRAEHEAVRRAAGVFDLTSAGKTWVAGRERQRFLDGLLAADIGSLAPGDGTYSLLLTRDGRIASDVRVVVLEDRCLLLTPSLTRGKVERTLERHRVATDVTISDATADRTLLTVQGPFGPAVVAEALECPVPEIRNWGGAEVRSVRYGPALLIRSPRTGEDGYDVLVPSKAAPAVFSRLVAVARAAGGLPCGLDALESLRIETGRFAFGSEMDETTLPVEVPEKLAGVCLTKGCFLGRQEAERSIAAASPARRVIGLTFGSGVPPVRGDKLKEDGRNVGRVSSACRSPSIGRAIGLAVVESGVAVPGRALETSDGDTATVTSLPFVAPRAR